MTPDLVGELGERQLRAVIKTMYRVLQKSFHPDVAPAGGEEPAEPPGERAVELNLAYESLDFEKDPAGFRRLRKSYLAKRPSSAWRNSILLKNQLEAQVEREDRLAANFFSYLANLSVPELIDPPPAALSSPIAAKSVRLGLVDVAINNNIRQASWLLGSNYKQMEFDADGGLRVKPVGRGRFSRSDYIRLLGSVPASAIDLEPLLERVNAQSFRRSASFPESVRPNLKVLNLIGLDNFKKHVLPLLAPVLQERAYLFSINTAEFKKTGLVSLEGVIVKLDRL